MTISNCRDSRGVSRKLIGSDDEFNRLGSEGEVPNGVGFRAAINSIATAVAMGADSQGDVGGKGQPEGVGRGILANMDDLETIQVKELRPKPQLFFLVHSQDSQSSDWATTFLLILQMMHRSSYKSAKVAESHRTETCESLRPHCQV
jgi:hypothetical protein